MLFWLKVCGIERWLFSLKVYDYTRQPSKLSMTNRNVWLRKCCVLTKNRASSCVVKSLYVFIVVVSEGVCGSRTTPSAVYVRANEVDSSYLATTGGKKNSLWSDRSTVGLAEIVVLAHPVCLLVVRLARFFRDKRASSIRWNSNSRRKVSDGIIV